MPKQRTMCTSKEICVEDSIGSSNMQHLRLMSAYFLVHLLSELTRSDTSLKGPHEETADIELTPSLHNTLTHAADT